MNTDSIAPFAIRPANPADASALARLFDDTIHWFTQVGSDEQWGKALYREHPAYRRDSAGLSASPNTYVAEREGVGLCGAIAFNEPDWWVPQVQPDDFYIRVLIGSREPEARGVGRALLEFARARAAQQGYGWLRADCYAGDPGKVPEYFESNGYTRTDTFSVDLGQTRWPGVVLRRPVGVADPTG